MIKSYETFRERILDNSYFHMFGCLVFIHKHKDHIGKFDTKADDRYFLGYSSVSKAFRVYKIRRQQIEETYYVTYDKSIEAIRFTKTSVDEIGINDSSRYPLDEFLHEDENHVLELIVPNEQDVPLTEDIEDPPNLINTEGTHEQNVQDDQRITQPTVVPSGNNTKALRPITEPLDRWSRDQHIELVNIIANLGEGMLTRSMATNLTAASTSKYLFANFLSEIEPKKVSKALKHPGWIDAMQEELNQNKKDEHGTTTKNKARLVAQGHSQEEGVNYNETFEPVARMEAIMIFLAFAIYINFKVYQMDVESAFLNDKLKEKGPEASRALSKKRTKPKSKRPPTETKEPPPKPTEGSEQSHSQDQPVPSHVQESASDSSSLDLKRFDNILPLTKRQLIRQDTFEIKSMMTEMYAAEGYVITQSHKRWGGEIEPKIPIEGKVKSDV
nr:hypothetical protein [Tanacetum cinerariifolium]